MCWREQSGVAERSDADERLIARWTLDSRVFLQKKYEKHCYSLKKIGFLLNLYPGEEPLRFRTNMPNRKCIHLTPFETFLGLASLYETLKVLRLDTGSVKNLFF